MTCLFMSFLTGCGDFSILPEKSPVISPEDENSQGPVLYGVGSYDSEDTPVLIGKDEEKKTLTFYNLDVGKNYTLEYDGTTCFYDKYGEAVSLSQLCPGDIVDVRFIKSKKHLSEMSLSKKAWVISETDRYEVNEVKNEVTIGEDTYKVSSDARYFSEDRQITEQDIIPTDKLTFRGIENRVYSVCVDKGHGYLRLTGHQGFIDGWIEIGNSIIRKVSEDMLITVPEGKYQVIISGSGTTAEKSVVINRNSESTLDFSDVEFEKPKTGTILFSLTPATAKLYVDGNLTDVSEKVELSYGLHQLICKAEGYSTITRYLNVGQSSAGIDITLESTKTEKDSKDDDSSSSKEENSGNGGSGGNSDSGDVLVTGGDDTSQDGQMGGDDSGGDGSYIEVTPTYYQVYIDSPTDVEVYLNGTYVGISPCSFRKKEGMHIITLSRSGYITRSYTISVDSDDKDISFSFADLVAEP